MTRLINDGFNKNNTRKAAFDEEAYLIDYKEYLKRRGERMNYNDMKHDALFETQNERLILERKDDLVQYYVENEDNISKDIVKHFFANHILFNKEQTQFEN